MPNIAVIVDSRGIDQTLVDSHMTYLPSWELDVVSDFTFSSPHDYNAVLTDKAFWLKYYNYERVLIFQTDSMLLKDGMDQFMEWDYVGSPWYQGAPWAHPDRKGGNGGLSLRNPRAMLDCLESYPYHGSVCNEDIFFVHNIEKLGFKVAPFEICERFACETVFAKGTVGYHNIDNYLTVQECLEIKTQYVN